MFKQNIKNFSVILGVSVLMSSCTLAPRYQTPTISSDVPVPVNQEVREQAREIGWRNYYQDSQLQTLVDLALKNNKDLRLALLTIEENKAQYGIARSQLFPGLNASGGMSRSGSRAESYIKEQYNAGLGITGFELDLFGKVRSQNNAALHTYLASKYGRDAAQVTIVSAVAKSYFSKRITGELVDLTKSILKTREERHKLIKLRYDAGIVSAIDLRQSESLVEQAKANLADQINSYLAAENALTLLVGTKIPEELPDQVDLDKQFSADLFPKNLKSEILLYRPDIQQSEEILKAANANIGAARAAFFPSIVLAGNYTTASSALDNLFKAANFGWSFGPSITVPIFNWGSNIANLDLAKIRKQQSIVQYEKVVQEAFRDVSDVFHANNYIKEQLDSQIKMDSANSETARLVNLRYQSGIDNALTLLDSQRETYSSKMAVLQAKLRLLHNKVDIYKVLGGGLNEVTIYENEQKNKSINSDSNK